MSSLRPASVLTIAILQFVFGALTLFCGVTSVLGEVGGQHFKFSGNPGDDKLEKDFADHLTQKLPNGKAIDIGEAVANVLLSIAMFLSGVGLLMMKSWGRTLALVQSALLLLILTGSIIRGLAVVQPICNEFAEQKLAQGNLSEDDKTGLSVLRIVLPAMAALMGVVAIYPLVTIIILLRPSVAAAFRRETRQPEIEEYYDEPRRDT